MLLNFHNAVTSQNWNEAIAYIISQKCSPTEKNENGWSARELARDHIHTAEAIEYFWGTIVQTPLESFLFQESHFGKRGHTQAIKALIALGADVNQKNTTGDNALMFYLKSITQFRPHEKNLPALEIIKLLISEGADFTPNNTEENPIQLAKEKFGEPLTHYMQKIVPVDLKTSSAIKIQRAWRALQYCKQNQKLFGKKTFGHLSTQEIEQNFPSHPKLTLQPKTPQFDNSIDPIKALEWVSLHAEEDRILATKVLKKIDHVSFDRFLFGLRKSIEKWNALIMSRPTSQRNYLILLDGREQKSIAWVTSHALPFLAHPPTQILTWDDLASIKKDIHHIIIIDDAVYSGNQMIGIIDGLLEERILDKYQYVLNAEFHLIIPFISEIGKQQLVEREVNVIHHETIPNFKNEGLPISGSTATYFAHKIAEKGISTIDLISSGKTIRGKPGISFIPTTLEPYKS